MLGAAPCVNAQSLRVGVRAGPTFGFLNDSPVPFVSEPEVTEASTNVRIDLHVGAHAVVPLGKNVSLQPELLFVRKGSHLSRNGVDLYIAEQYRLSYLEGHLLGRRAVPVPGPLSVHAVAGLSRRTDADASQPPDKPATACTDSGPGTGTARRPSRCPSR